jgi:hypothetical protein
MQLFPSEQLEYHTPYTAQVVLQRISNSIEPVRRFHIFGDPEKKYEGVVKESEFQLSRITAFLDMANPLIQGNVQHVDEMCCVSVSIQLPVFPRVLIMFLFALLGLDLWPILYYLFVAGLDYVNFTLFVFHGILLLFVYLYATLGFQRQSKVARKYLAELFECNPTLVD